MIPAVLLSCVYNLVWGWCGSHLVPSVGVSSPEELSLLVLRGVSGSSSIVVSILSLFLLSAALPDVSMACNTGAAIARATEYVGSLEHAHSQLSTSPQSAHVLKTAIGVLRPT